MKRLASLCSALIVAIPTAASAGGLFLPGVGPQSQARAGAFVAKADDPSALGTNPAGIAKLSGTQIYIGLSFYDYNLSYRRAGQWESGPLEGQDYPEVENDASPNVGFAGFQAIPNFVITTDFGKPEWPFRFAAGLVAPTAYPNREFAETIDGALGPQRYDVISQKAETALPSVGVTYSPLPFLDIGARASWGFSSLNATTQVWGVRNFEESEEFDGTFQLRADDNFVPAFGLGFLVRPLPNVEIGASYSSGLNIDAEGFAPQPVLGEGVGFEEPERLLPVDDDMAACAGGGTEEELAACIQVNLPQKAHVGARYVFTDENDEPRGDIELDVVWENWGGRCDIARDIQIFARDDRPCGDHVVVVDAESFTVPGRFVQPSLIQHFMNDVWSVRLGGSYRLPLVASDLEFRGGLAFDTAAADEVSNRADLDTASRFTIGFGAAYELGRFTFEAGGGVILQGDRSVDQCRPETNGPVVGFPQEGCAPDGSSTPPLERTQPSPITALSDASAQFDSPFNAGDYSSGYFLFNLGFRARL